MDKKIKALLVDLDECIHENWWFEISPENAKLLRDYIQDLQAIDHEELIEYDQGKTHE